MLPVPAGREATPKARWTAVRASGRPALNLARSSGTAHHDLCPVDAREPWQGWRTKRTVAAILNACQKPRATRSDLPVRDPGFDGHFLLAHAVAVRIFNFIPQRWFIGKEIEMRAILLALLFLIGADYPVAGESVQTEVDPLYVYVSCGDETVSNGDESFDLAQAGSCGCTWVMNNRCRSCGGSCPNPGGTWNTAGTCVMHSPTGFGGYCACRYRQ